MLISELYLNKKNYLYEGLDTKNLQSVMLWESAGRKIVEAQLTANQVLQIFQQAEQGASAAGGNRTLVGKGKDAATAVNQAWEDLKTKVQNSGPIKNVDAMYDQAAEKLKQATGGDAGVMQYVQKYRDFAKKHPVAQSLIYSALIAAAGLSGAGLGGAAALGLFKMTDKLLQGEKFSSAAYSGAKTGAAAYAAGQVGKSMQGSDTGATQAASQAGGLTRMNVDTWQANPYYAKELARGLNDPGISQAWKDQFIAQLNRSVANPTDNRSLASAWQMATKAATLKAGNPYGVNESKLTEGQVTQIFALAIAAQLNEGIMDTIKGAASGAVNKAGQWLQTKGHNLTTKITADKLAQAWEKAGSPMDSEGVAAVLKAQGVADDVIANVYSQMKLPAPAADAAATTSAPTTAADTVATTAPTGKVDSMLATLVDYVKQGGTITPKQRGAIKDLWLRIGGAQLAESKRKKKNSP